jgi:hypothetical protein
LDREAVACHLMRRVARFLSISGHEFPLPTPGVFA